MTDLNLLTVDDLSGMLSVPRQTLYAWHSRRIGPQAIKVGRHLRYRPADVDRWLDSLAGDGPLAGSRH